MSTYTPLGGRQSAPGASPVTEEVKRTWVSGEYGCLVGVQSDLSEWENDRDFCIARKTHLEDGGDPNLPSYAKLIEITLTHLIGDDCPIEEFSTCLGVLTDGLSSAKDAWETLQNTDLNNATYLKHANNWNSAWAELEKTWNACTPAHEQAMVICEAMNPETLQRNTPEEKQEF